MHSSDNQQHIVEVSLLSYITSLAHMLALHRVFESTTLFCTPNDCTLRKYAYDTMIGKRFRIWVMFDK